MSTWGQLFNKLDQGEAFDRMIAFEKRRRHNKGVLLRQTARAAARAKAIRRSNVRNYWGKE